MIGKKRTGTLKVERNQAGEFYYTLTANNGEILAHGEGYGSVRDAVRGAKTLRRVAKRAKVEVVGG